MNIIFLDIDGVLITENSAIAAMENGKRGWDVPDKACIARLNRLTDKTGASIVLSSAWRVGLTAAQCADLLKGWGVTGNLVSRTPNSKADQERGDEIATWMQWWGQFTTTPVENFVIIDDCDDMGVLESFLVQTSFVNGLQDEHVEQAERILNAKSILSVVPSIPSADRLHERRQREAHIGE